MEQAVKKMKATQDMTTGSPIKLILQFAVPAFFLALLFNLYNLADGKIVGEFVSVAAFTAIGSTHILVQTFGGITGNMAQGFCITIANKFGAKDFLQLKRSTAVIYVLFAICVIVVMLIEFLATKYLLIYLDTPSELMELALPYLYIIYIGTPFTAFQNLFTYMMRSVGNSTIGLIIYAISTVLNIGVTLLFVVVFKWGVAGAAAGTVVCQFISCILTYVIMRKKFRLFDIDKSHFVFEKQGVFQLLSLGVSMSLMNLLVNVGGMILQFAINGLGSLTILAHTAARRIDTLIMIPITTLTNSIAVYVAQNVGIKNFQRIKQGMKQTMIVCMFLNVFMVIIAAIFGRFLIGWACGSNDPAMLDIAFKYLFINISSMVFLASLFLYKSALIGINRGGATLVTGIVEFCIKTFISLVLINYMGYMAIIISEPVSWLVMTIIEIIYFNYYYNKMVQNK